MPFARAKQSPRRFIPSFGRSAPQRRIPARAIAGGVAAAGALAAAVIAGRKGAGSKARRAAGATMRHMQGRAKGLAYRMRGGHPARDVGDDVLADRIRSRLGPVEKRLDLPRVHVMVRDGVAMLHGAVATEEEEQGLVKATGKVAGVRGVDSRLHIGLGPADTRPSAGRAMAQRSEALHRLHAATSEALGFGEPDPAGVLGAVLTTLARSLPAGERVHLFGHLPADVRDLAQLPHGDAPVIVRTRKAFAEAVAVEAGIDPAAAGHVTTRVLALLHDMIPEERHDVGAVLPKDLRKLWRATVTAGEEAGR